jgi:hypothetical protein
VNTEVLRMEVGKLSLSEYDILVIKIPHNMPKDMYPIVREEAQKLHKFVFLLSDAFDIGVINKEDDEFNSLFKVD